MDTVKRLGELLEERNISLYEFSKQSNLQYSSIGATKRRGGNLSIDTIEKICEFFDMPLFEYFMTDEDWELFDKYYAARNKSNEKQ